MSGRESLAAARPMIGRMVLHYRVEERLGAGGMGEVYRARDLRLGREVALKLLAPVRQADAESRARLLREARAAAVLASPHVAAVYDVEEHEGVPFLVQEYVRGEPLSDRIARGPLPVSEAVAIAMQVADALQDIHAHGLVHRDIKSSNIIVDDRGNAKVIDFGLAKHSPDPAITGNQTTASVTVPGMIVGTLAYMSPEQARSRPVDARSDLFSLGVVLYEMLAGALPFDTSSAATLIDGILHRSPPALPRGFAAFAAVVDRALAKEPAERYQSAADFRAALEAVRRSLTSTPEGAGHDGLISADAVVTRTATPAGRGGHRVAVLRFRNITGQPADDWIGAGLAETVTWDLRRVGAVTVIGSEQVVDALRRVDADGTAPPTQDDSALELGRLVGATCIVTGAYQRQGSALRISARFVDVATGTVTKSVRFDGDISRVFALQDQIVRELTEGLELQLRASELQAIEEPETRSIDAYECYSRGLLELRRAEGPSLERAIELFERAVEHDPRYARAWAALGAAYDLKAFFSGSPHWSDRAIELERKALAIDPHLSVAHHWLGVAYLNAGRFEQAIAASAEAIRLDPGNALAHAALGRGLAFGRGRLLEAIGELDEAVRIDATLGYAHLLSARLYLLRGENGRAELAARRAVQLQRAGTSLRGPSVAGAHLTLGLVHYWQGQYEAALREYEHERAWVRSANHAEGGRILLELEQRLSAVFWRMGRRDEADGHFHIVSKAFEHQGEDRPAGGLEDYGMAALLALRGDTDRAFAFLKDAITVLPLFVPTLLDRDPDWDRLRNDPRIREGVSDPH